MLTQNDVVQGFNEGFDCAQILFGHWAESLGLDKKTAIKLCSGFAAGMSQGETCGAIIAAYLAIALKYGYNTSDDEGMLQKVETIKAQTRFRELFNTKYKSTMCRELLDADIRTEEGRQKMAETDPMNNFCPKLITDINTALKEVLNG